MAKRDPLSSIELSNSELDDLYTQMRIECGDKSTIDPAADLPDWIRSTGWTPVEFLLATMRNPFQAMNNRITAAKAVMDYAHKKQPAALELSGKDGAPIKVASLSALSVEELEQLEALLTKANGKGVAL